MGKLAKRLVSFQAYGSSALYRPAAGRNGEAVVNADLKAGNAMSGSYGGVVGDDGDTLEVRKRCSRVTCVSCNV